MLKQTVQILSLAGVLVSGSTGAISLGAAKFESYLNEPLNVTIQVANPHQLNAQQVIVRPANSDELQRLGLDDDQIVSKLQVSIEATNSEQLRVRVWSSQVLSDPNARFVLFYRWPTGTVLQKYTLLVPDLPKQQEQTITSGMLESVQGDMEMLEVEWTRSDSASEPGKVWDVDTSAAGRSQWTVEPGQSLSEIAIHLRPANTVSVEQMMVAIIKKNTAAFAQNEGTQLEPGTVLDVPDLSEIKRVDKQAASRELERRSELWNKLAMKEDSIKEPVQSPVLAPGFLRLGLAPTVEEETQGTNSIAVLDLQERLDNALARLKDANDVISNSMNDIERLNGLVEELQKTIAQKSAQLTKLQFQVAANDASRLIAQETAEQASLQEPEPSTLSEPLQSSRGFWGTLAAALSAVFAVLTFARWRRRKSESEYSEPDQLALDRNDKRLQGVAENDPADDLPLSQRQLLEAIAADDALPEELAASEYDESAPPAWTPSPGPAEAVASPLKATKSGIASEAMPTVIDKHTKPKRNKENKTMEDLGMITEVEATPLELVQAYIELDDPEGARRMLEELLAEGDSREKARAKELLAELS